MEAGNPFVPDVSPEKRPADDHVRETIAPAEKAEPPGQTDVRSLELVGPAVLPALDASPCDRG